MCSHICCDIKDEKLVCLACHEVVEDIKNYNDLRKIKSRYT